MKHKNDNHNNYFKEMFMIGIPVTLQSIFQASYSFVDQVMVGKLGEGCIAGSGLGAKFSSLVTFTLSSVAAVASILIAQYHGNKDGKGINKSFSYCSYIAVLVMALFTIPSFLFPQSIIRMYTDKMDVIGIAADYLRIIAISYIPMSITLMLSSLFRSIEESRYPMYASVVSVISNIIFNYLLIFGKFGFPKLGLEGAAYGTLISRTLEAIILIVVLFARQNKRYFQLHMVGVGDNSFYKKIAAIVLPILLNEFSWSVGENIYAGIYGRMGTDDLAAMTLTNPLQGMFIGMFSGLSSAALVMVGKRLGQNNKKEAYSISKYILKAGLIGSIIIAGILVVLVPFYVKFFTIEPEVEQITIYIVYALAAIIFAKILNMILGGGIIRSGGNTRYTLVVDLIGTWVFGVPLGLLTAFVFKLPIYWVYFILSLEEVVRLIIGLFIFKSRKWMRNVTEK